MPYNLYFLPRGTWINYLSALSALGTRYRLKNIRVHCLLSNRTMHERKNAGNFLFVATNAVCVCLCMCCGIGCDTFNLAMHYKSTIMQHSLHSQSMFAAHSAKKPRESTKSMHKMSERSTWTGGERNGISDWNPWVAFRCIGIELHKCVVCVSKSSKQTINRNNMKEDRYVLYTDVWQYIAPVEFVLSGVCSRSLYLRVSISFVQTTFMVCTVEHPVVC